MQCGTELRDIAAVLCAIELNACGCRVGDAACIRDGVSGGNHVQHAAAGGHQLVVVVGPGAGVQYERAGGSRVVEPADRAAGDGMLGVPLGCDHHGHRGIVAQRELFGMLVKRAVGGCEQQRRKRFAQALEHHLRFGVTEAGVELDHANTRGGDDQPAVQQPLERVAVGAQRVDHRLRHRADRLGDKLLLAAEAVVQEGHRGVGAHAAGVGAVVAVVEAFEILCRGECANGFAVAEAEQ